MNNEKEGNNYYDITVIGGCSIDQLYYAQEDNTYKKEPDRYVPGGKGANQAVAAARAGARVNMISIVENNSIGKSIIENLKINNVNTSDIELLDDTKNDVAKVYINNVDADNIVQRLNGAINSFSPDMIDKYADRLKKSKLVVSQMKMPKEVSEKLIEFCNTNYIPLMITPSPAEKLSTKEDPSNEKLIEKITYLTCNKKECKTVFGTDNIDYCVSKFPNKLIVTLGKDGIVYHDGKRVVHLPALKLDKIVDTIGAGDTFAGNLAALLIQGNSLKESIYRAQFAAAIKIGSKSAQDGMPYKEQLDKCVYAYENGQRINWEDISHQETFIFNSEEINF